MWEKMPRRVKVARMGASKFSDPSLSLTDVVGHSKNGLNDGVCGVRLEIARGVMNEGVTPRLLGKAMNGEEPILSGYDRGQRSL